MHIYNIGSGQMKSNRGSLTSTGPIGRKAKDQAPSSLEMEYPDGFENKARALRFKRSDGMESVAKCEQIMTS